MKEVVVMPTCKRPEMLALALRAIDQADNPPNDIRIFCDTDTNVQEVEYVRDTYLPHAMIFHAGQHPSLPSGMWNILNSMKQGYETGADLIYHVEEDVLVKPDFFEWHRSMDYPDLMATCGRIMERFPNYLQYTNPGACLRRAGLGLVVEHITDDLFRNHEQYMDRFGPMEESSKLDDGLIRRVARQHGLRVMYPWKPKCAHIGFRGYRRYDIFQNNGNIVERIAGLERMLPNVRNHDPRYGQDCEL